MENTNLTRKQQKIFAGNTTVSEEQIAVFGSKTQTGTMAFSKDPDVIQNENWQNGWQNATVLEQAPFEEDFNAISFVNSYNTAYLLQKGIPEYSASTTYFKGSICSIINSSSEPSLYYSLTDNNIGNNPTTDSINWAKFLGNSATFFSQNITTDMDFNNFANRGSYYIYALAANTIVSTTKANGPYNANNYAGTLVVQNGDNNDINFVFQRFNCVTDGRMWYRVKLNGVWRSWIEIKNKYIPDYTAGVVVSSRSSFTAPSDGVLIGWAKYPAGTSTNSQDIGVFTDISRSVRIAGINSNSEAPIYSCFNVIVKSGLTYGLNGQEGSLTFYPFSN